MATLKNLGHLPELPDCGGTDVLGKTARTGGTFIDAPRVDGVGVDEAPRASDGPGVDEAPRVDDGLGVDDEVPRADRAGVDEPGADSFATHRAVARVQAWYSLSVSKVLKCLHVSLAK